MKKPVPRAGAGPGRMPAMPVRRPQPGRRRTMNAERAAAIGSRAGANRRGATVQRAAMERKGWGGIPLLGMFIEPLLNFIFPGRAHRTGVRRGPGSVAGKAGSLLGVRMDIHKANIEARREAARESVRPSYRRPGERARHVTVAKASQAARRGGKPYGVLKKAA